MDAIVDHITEYASKRKVKLSALNASQISKVVKVLREEFSEELSTNRKLEVFPVYSDSISDLKNGERAIIDKVAKLENGNIVLALTDAFPVFRRFYRNGDGTVTLKSDNPRYQDMTFGDEADAAVGGVVVGHIF